MKTIGPQNNTNWHILLVYRSTEQGLASSKRDYFIRFAGGVVVD